MTAPKLRFSEFKDEWIKTRIGESFQLISGFAFPSSAKSNSDGAKWLKIADVGIQKMNPSNPSFLPKQYLQTYSNFIVKKDDYVVALTRPILNGELKISQVGDFYDNALLNQRVAKLASEDNNLKFIYCLLQKSETVKDIENSIAGTDPPNLSLNEIKDITISLPTVEEQTKIAEFLSVVDDKISQLSRQLELLNQYKKGVMQKIFSQEIRFKNDNGEDFGEWEKVKFSDIFIEIKDKVGNKNIETYSITAGKGFVSQSEKFGRDISGSQNENYIVLGKNDFSYNKGNSKTYKFGCVYLNNTGQNIAVPNVFISFRAKKNNIAHNFYAKLFEHHYLDRYLRQLISSSARMDGLLNISKEGFFEIPLPFPPIPEQEKIAEFLTAIDEQIDHTTAQLTHTKHWKKGLLQQMFV